MASAPIPLFDVSAARTRLHQSPDYLARAGFTSSVGWREDKGGHTLFRYIATPPGPNDPAEPYGYITTVGTVLSNKFFLGPVGAWSNKFGQAISAAKISFMLGRPSIEEFGRDWDTAIQNAGTIQSSINNGGSPANWIMNENGLECMKMGMKIFEKKGGDSPSGVDISKWPVPSAYKDHLAAIVNTHDVRLLTVYDVDETLVAPASVEKMLRGALVECTYKIMHYSFEKEGSAVSSFTADIQQIVILKHGPPAPAPVFRRAARPIRAAAAAPAPPAGHSPGAPAGSPARSEDLNSGKHSASQTDPNGKKRSAEDPATGGSGKKPPDIYVYTSQASANGTEKKRLFGRGFLRVLSSFRQRPLDLSNVTQFEPRIPQSRLGSLEQRSRSLKSFLNKQIAEIATDCINATKFGERQHRQLCLWATGKRGGKPGRLPSSSSTAFFFAFATITASTPYTIIEFVHTENNRLLAKNLMEELGLFRSDYGPFTQTTLATYTNTGSTTPPNTSYQITGEDIVIGSSDSTYRGE
ncbi:hypothetical protein C8F04DRAFT_1258185 [Mycena alexandri]|uniref:Uncharacterized protein n=1 Tax=Mycena alexandri TaxID=1745969 RepID=A0AAD6T1U2_9AGAR|nr:hypothetical protein C8F04DRAFT_1258185 [Mycena alexandri]